jgi:hypothetical protein
MKTLAAIALAAVSLSASSVPPVVPAPEKPIQVAQNVTCFFKSETTSGMNKMCFYDCLGSAAAITISSVQLCPLTIKR